MTIEHFVYDQGDNSVSVEHYKYIGGDHVWFNETYQGQNASKLVWNFMSRYDINGLRIKLISKERLEHAILFLHKSKVWQWLYLLYINNNILP
jgi:hypothetical protein